MSAPSTEEIQRAYYRKTADKYDDLHVSQDDEHYLALSWMLSLVDYLGCRSILDVGSGTGRAVAFLLDRRPDIQVVGIEPSAELRCIGNQRGIPTHVLRDGNANRLDFADGSFDLVCEFGVLHHLAEPRLAIAEMVRVARRGIFISDDNHFGGGSHLAQRVKRGLDILGLWRLAYWLRSGGKGYRITESDGLAYPYSVFDDLDLLNACCSAVHCLNTRGHGPSLRSSASHVAVCGFKAETVIA